VWNILCQRGTAPQAQGEILCAAASVEGIGSLAIQAEVAHFGRQDFRYRRSCCSALYLGLLSAINLLKIQGALEREQKREEQVRHLVHSNALARNEEREHLSVQLHDSVIQNMVSAFHMVEAIREMSTAQSEQGAILQKAEEALSQAIRELRGVINTLHTAAPAEEMK
jgi:signal transduction histidine kinase